MKCSAVAAKVSSSHSVKRYKKKLDDPFPACNKIYSPRKSRLSCRPTISMKSTVHSQLRSSPEKRPVPDGEGLQRLLKYGGGHLRVVLELEGVAAAAGRIDAHHVLGVVAFLELGYALVAHDELRSVRRVDVRRREFAVHLLLEQHCHLVRSAAVGLSDLVEEVVRALGVRHALLVLQQLHDDALIRGRVSEHLLVVRHLPERAHIRKTLRDLAT
ncbi:hypothetical protein GQ600_21342 [Phytophthora cactorum]|nr:hypothetical protein GQ600_21342 [Phytophthora cactorum]